MYEEIRVFPLGYLCVCVFEIYLQIFTYSKIYIHCIFAVLIHYLYFIKCFDEKKKEIKPVLFEFFVCILICIRNVSLLHNTSNSYSSDVGVKSLLL